MKRPIGVILTCIVLGLFSAGNLLLFVATLLGGAVVAHHAHSAEGAPSMVTPGFVFGLMLVVSLLFAGVAAWTITTLVGLARLRNWARYSVLILGGMLAGLGVISALGVAILPAVPPPAAPGAPQITPGMMHAELIAIAFFYAGVAAVGAWWLVYFNLRSVKAYFLPRYSPPAPAYPYGFPPQSAASLATPGGLPYPPPPLPGDLPGSSRQFIPAPPGRFSGVPVPIAILACLFLLGCVSCLGAALIPVPALFLGLFLRGAAKFALYGVLAVFCLFLGIGLLRLDNRARIAGLAYSTFGFLNGAFLLSPWGRARQAQMMDELNQRMHLPTAQGINPYANPGFSLLIAGVLVVFTCLQVWVLIYYRPAFHKTTAPHEP